MNTRRRQKLQDQGWRLGSVAEFLELTPEESHYTALRLKLAAGLRARRRGRRLTQVQAAKVLKSSQSRLAKMEAGDPSVSLDLLIRSHLALGSCPTDLARLISGRASADAE